MAAKKKAESTRFVGWQKTPIHQATFGQTTKGGKNNQTFEMKNSTGPVQSVSADAWFLLDASKIPVGRLATTAATVLMGKHKPTFTPGADSGDSVVVINADKAYFTSNKDEKKIYYWHTQWAGGIRSETAGEALKKHPEKVIWDAVWGMLPKNRLSRKQIARLKVHKGEEHPHGAQKPKEIDLSQGKLLKRLVG